MAVAREHEEEYEADSEKDGHDPVIRFRGVGEPRGAADRQGRERQVIEARSVMVFRVVMVLASVEEDAGPCGLVGLIGMHRPLVEPRQADREGPHGHGHDAQAEHHSGAFHFGALP